MVPTDPVFTTPDPGTTAAPVAAPTAAPSADLDARISAAIAPLATSMKTVEKFMGSVSDHLQNQPAASESAAVPEGEFWTKFAANPEGALDDRLNKVAGPLIGQLADNQSQAHIEKFQTELDGAWGKGAYETIIKTDLDSIIKRALIQNPAAVLNREALRTTMDALVGRNVTALAGHKEKAQVTRGEHTTTEVEAAVQAALQKHGIDSTTLSGGIRRVSPVGDKLPDDLHEYLAGKLRDTGMKVDEKRAARMMGVGPSFAEWEAANTELEK